MNISYPSVLTFVLGAQKNHLIETVLLSTHNIVLVEKLEKKIAHSYLDLDARKPVFVFANNKDTDQPAHPHSLISAFVILLLESIISKLATSKFSIF